MWLWSLLTWTYLGVSAPNMERDFVNYPACVRPVEKAPVRCLDFPEEWFTACYSKTGVTGPYMFLVGVGTFLATEEFFVMEHDFYVGLGLFTYSALLIDKPSSKFQLSPNQYKNQSPPKLSAACFSDREGMNCISRSRAKGSPAPQVRP